MERKVVVVTGASGGVGSHLAASLFEDNFIVVAQYRSRMTKMNYDEFIAVQADLRTKEGIEALYRSVMVATGGEPPYAVINVAGKSTNGVSWNLTDDAVHDVIDTNFMSTFGVCREFVSKMRKSGKKHRIINVSSIVASAGAPGASHYSASKAAIEGYTRSLALELAETPITVNCIALGYFDCGIIRTIPDNVLPHIVEKIPQKRLGTIEELYEPFKFLLDSGSSYITGQVLHVDGGLGR